MGSGYQTKGDISFYIKTLVDIISWLYFLDLISRPTRYLKVQFKVQACALAHSD